MEIPTSNGRPVSHILFAKFPNTFKLAGLALLIEALFGIIAGILSAVKRYSFWDILVTLSTSVLVSLPVFWLGMILQYVFAIKLRILPPSGLGGADHLLMPGAHTRVRIHGLLSAHRTESVA